MCCFPNGAHDVALIQREIESKREHFSVSSLTGTNYSQPATYPNPLKESTASKVREFHLHIGFKTPWDIFSPACPTFTNFVKFNDRGSALISRLLSFMCNLFLTLVQNRRYLCQSPFFCFTPRPLSCAWQRLHLFLAWQSTLHQLHALARWRWSCAAFLRMTPVVYFPALATSVFPRLTLVASFPALDDG